MKAILLFCLTLIMAHAMGCRQIVATSPDARALNALKAYKPRYWLDNHGKVIDLNLDRATIDDVALAQLATLTCLRGLSLQGTMLKDASLMALWKLKCLESLTLGDTLITDDGISTLRALPSLRWLWLGGCKNIRGEGIDELERALPDLVVYR